MRELAWMAIRRLELEWDQTSGVVAMIYNVNRGKDSPMILPEQFNPMRAKPTAKLTPRESVIQLARAFGFQNEKL